MQVYWKDWSACGIDNHEILPILFVTADVITTVTVGEIIVMLNQCSCYGKVKTAHSSRQIEACDSIVDDSIKVGGHQHGIALIIAN